MSFTGVTVTVKKFVTVSTPPKATPPWSFTTTMMVATPLELATGVNFRVPVVLAFV